jgi:hypothetical protein
MVEKRYCLHEPILSVYRGGSGQRECIYVPAGELISVRDPNSANTKFVEVHWDAKLLLMFQQDIEDRAELVQVAMPGAA